MQMLTDYPVDHDGEDRDTLANAVFNPDKKLLDVFGRRAEAVIREPYRGRQADHTGSKTP
ncbi:MAG: hypothetical protein ACLTAX_10715 [Waltera sp.]